MASDFDVPKGEQSTVDGSVGIAGGFVVDLKSFTAKKPEDVVRPFQGFRERYDQRMAELRAPPGAEDADPELCMGGPGATSGLILNDPPTDPIIGGFTTRPSDEEEEEPDPEQQFVWEEIRRETRKVRVTNPDDDDDYVIVKRVERIDFRAPSQAPFNGYTHTFKFKNSGST